MSAPGLEPVLTAPRRHHVPPLVSSSSSSSRESKKSRRNAAKGKATTNKELKKRGAPSTPSNSDDAEKPQTEPRCGEKSTDPKQTKGQAKEQGGRKSRKCKTTKLRVKEEEPEPAPGPDTEDQTQPNGSAPESLRWEGVLDDPAAEARRLEIYRANRRQRYLASRQILPENICS